jgi:hypothetical protein
MGFDKEFCRSGTTPVNFEKSLIFSPVIRCQADAEELNPKSISFFAPHRRSRSSWSILGGTKRFSPEFVNRIDAIVTYQPLDTSN